MKIGEVYEKWLKFVKIQKVVKRGVCSGLEYNVLQMRFLKTGFLSTFGGVF